MSKRWPFSPLNWSEHKVTSGCWLSSWLRNSWMVDSMVGIFLGSLNILFFAVHVLPKKIGVRNRKSFVSRQSVYVHRLVWIQLQPLQGINGFVSGKFCPDYWTLRSQDGFGKFFPLQLCNKLQSKFFIMKLSSPSKRWFMVGYQTCRSLLSTTEKQVSSPRWLIHVVDDE